MAAWYDSAVFYHIYPLGLCGSPKINDYQGGGQGFKQLDLWVAHMAELGCTAVYIGPLFESATHGYDTTDYKKVDSRLGTNEDFIRWVKLCHNSGIRVVVDGVFNHTGRDFAAFKNLKEEREGSWGKDWYCQVNFWGNSPFNDGFSYESWHGFAQLPRLNMANPAVREFLLDVVQYWVQTFDIDGIRLDCADVLDFNFMRELRTLTDGLKPDFWLMGEVIHGDYSRWVNPQMLHSVTNYELHKGIYSAHNSYNYFEMAHSIRRMYDKNYGICKDARLYNFVDNHDVDRIYDKLENKKNLFPVYAFLFTTIGIPSVYYGSEWGIAGHKENGSDDPLRPAIDLATFKGPNLELEAFIAKLAHIHTECPELIYGQLDELLLTNRQYAYARVYEGKACITILNNDEQEVRVDIKLPFGGGVCTDLIREEDVPVQGDHLSLTVSGNGAMVLRLC
ncbi:alpha-amylase family glycosyl hydrolase [Catenibacillus scindens]|uniref:alpha-amylase family glycosyl hydrolase n=1 Tax=Catenibacillus scindens TaxID=673271 RepID=UPI0032083780